MKIQGKKIACRNTDFLVIPRPPVQTNETQEDGTTKIVEISGDIVFKAEAVLSYEKFDQYVPSPKPPMSLKRGQSVATPNPDHPSYQVALNRYASLKTTWMILESLRVTPDLEWETVKEEDPSTWENYLTELQDAGFNQIEIIRIQTLALKVNSLDEEMLDAARNRFLAGQAVAGN